MIGLPSFDKVLISHNVSLSIEISNGDVRAFVGVRVAIWIPFDFTISIWTFPPVWLVVIEVIQGATGCVFGRLEKFVLALYQSPDDGLACRVSCGLRSDIAKQKPA